MGYQELFKESNEEVLERFELAWGRIAEIGEEKTVPEVYRDYFQKTAQFLYLSGRILSQAETGELSERTLKECEELNERLYGELMGPNYADSYANPRAAVRRLGEPFGALLSFLYTELRAAAIYAFEGRKKNLTILYELLIEIYNCFEGEEGPDKQEIKHIVYWFFHDYTEVFAEDKVRELVDPDYDFFTNIVMESDFADLRYLYRYGEYIGGNERMAAQFLNTLTEQEICAMADTMTKGFAIGYANLGKDLSRKGTVCMEYPIGFERVVRAAIRNFANMGLRTTIHRSPFSSFDRGSSRRRGCYASSENRQFVFDHKADSAFYLDKSYVKRRLESMQSAFEKYKKQAGQYAGPAVMEVFGESPFVPEVKPEASRYDGAQNALNVSLANSLSQLTNTYIPGDERSFTIIAYPIPAIGPQFEAIFRETVVLNTLDYRTYRAIQQKLIHVLDTAERVHITGKNGNKTDLWVTIHPLFNPERETAFENCVADVNIPVGEVFTSPILEGTNGKLHVTRVYLNGLEYQDLELDFQDGKIAGYTCSNFSTEEENRRFLYENLLQQHETLPMGEFAIGTNTTAYRMAQKYGIADKLPILIAEKTGPHFAVGDTCYAHAEDVRVYNPDGKEIVAKDNSMSALRSKDLSLAYVNCHTDITIPYDELDAIVAVRKDGNSVAIIQDGKFVVPGTEALNEPLEQLIDECSIYN